MDDTQAQRIADDIFDNIFSSCMDLTSFKELDDHFKTYSDLTVAHGQIRLRPGTRKNIKAFVQWTRDEIRLKREPSLTLTETAEPDKFKESLSGRIGNPPSSTKSTIPGRDGVPLKCVCCEIDETPNEDFLNDYVAMALLESNSFAIDTVQVLTFLVNFVSVKRFRALWSTMKESEFIQLTFEKPMKSSGVSFMPERNLHICGRRNLRNDSSLEHLMPTSNAKDVLFTPIQ
jgi:hypothetical protein